MDDYRNPIDRVPQVQYPSLIMHARLCMRNERPRVLARVGLSELSQSRGLTVSDFHRRLVLIKFCSRGSSSICVIAAAHILFAGNVCAAPADQRLNAIEQQNRLLRQEVQDLKSELGAVERRVAETQAALHHVEPPQRRKNLHGPAQEQFKQAAVAQQAASPPHPQSGFAVAVAKPIPTEAVSLEPPTPSPPQMGEDTPPPAEPERLFEIYGFAQADYIQDFNRVDPNWTAALRPSKIPTRAGQYGSNGESDIGVRQSRFGVNAALPAGPYELSTKFEFDLFGVGVDAGQTTFRLRQAYGEWGPILAGQTNSLFMDGDLFPNVIDYWGPDGMVFVRNPQFRWTAFSKGGTKFAMAIEKPSNDIDPGNIIALDPALGANLQNHEPYPDMTAQWRREDSWGHVQISGVVRDVAYDTAATTNNRPKGGRIGYGINLGSSFNLSQQDTLRLGGVYGQGIASYMNDGGTDLAPQQQFPSSALQPRAVPLYGILAYLDHTWSTQFSSAIGYSRSQVSNTNFQTQSAYHTGQYASVNLLFTPFKNIMFGGELLWGSRTDRDSSNGDDVRLQISAKYSFSSGNVLERN